jgi:hypothetical protein
MPRKIKRPAARSGGMKSRIRTSRPAGKARQVGRAKVSNFTRNRQQAARQQAIRRQGRQAHRVRPVVRPAAAPRKIMPRQSAPVNISSVAASRPRRMARPTSTPVAQAGRPARPRARPKPAAAPALRVRPKAQAVAAAAVVGGALGAAAFQLNTSRAHPALTPELHSLQYALSSLQDLSSFDDMRDDLAQLDRELAHTLDLLESARARGYRYQGDLDRLANETMGLWQQVYQPSVAAVEAQSRAFQSRLAPLGSQLPRLNAHLGSPTAASPHLRQAESTVNVLLREVNQIRGDIRSEYAEVEGNVMRLNSRLTVIHWALSQLEEAQFSLEEGENLVMAVKNRLDQEGKNDPEGILFLTDRRLIFERKEKVATKKVLFITTEKELVQEVVFAEPVSNLAQVKAQTKGLFGHQDFLEVGLGSAGVLSLHLDGQDSQEWAVLIQKVQSGKIAEERAIEGGLSFRDLSGAISQADIVAIQSEVNQIQDELMLAEAREELEELENEVQSLARDLADVRARGYAVESDLEGDIAILTAQWERVKGNAEKTIGLQAGILAEQTQNIQSLMSQLAGMSGNLAAARPVYMQLKSALASAEAQAAAAQETVYSQFDDYAAEVEGMDAHLDWVDWMLDALATASFRLLATESGVAATEASFAFAGMEPENGVLILTDQRLLWEDRVGDYELKVDAPLSWVEKATLEGAEDGAETLVFTFGGQSPLPLGRFILAAPVGEDWLQMIGRARGGEYHADRAVEIDPAEIERVKNAPTQCPNCGAQFTMPVLRGQTEMTCEFCSTVTRI